MSALTPQELGGLATASTTVSDPKSAAWRAAFKAQVTPDLFDDVTAYIAKRASWIEHQSGRRAPGLIQEMVQDALGDTFAGIVTWNPERCSLALHLKSVLRSRLSHELERAEDYNHFSLDSVSEEEVSTALEAGTTVVKPEVTAYADAFAARLRADAGDDEAVLRLIDVYCEGVTERRDVCRVARMKPSTYHNAHRRLKRLVENLPEQLRAAAIAAMA